MKLLYKNIVVGNLNDLGCNMNREGGGLDLLPVHERELSKLSDQLFEWVETSARLEELELALDEDDGERSGEIEKLWEKQSKLPDFGNHDCWRLFDEETGRTENISSPRFWQGGAGWYFDVPESKKEEKDFSSVLGLLIGLILVAIWAYITHG